MVMLASPPPPDDRDFSALIPSPVSYWPTAHLLPPLIDIRTNRDLDSLRDSIRKEGVLIPLIVYHDSKFGKKRVLDGETRRQVALLEGIAEVPTQEVAEPKDEAELIRRMTVPNLLRNSLSRIDTAKALLRILEVKQCQLKEACYDIGMSEGNGTKLLTGFLNVPPETREGLPVSVTYQLGRLKGELSVHQKPLAEAYREGSLNREQVADQVNKLLAEKGKGKRKESPITICWNGIKVILPGAVTWEKLCEFIATLQREIKRAQTIGIDPRLFPNLFDGKDGVK